MSTTGSSSISTSGLTANSQLTNSGVGGTLQITGLATGLNTNEIIQAELAVQEQPLTNMQNEISGLNTENSTLNSIQSDLQAVSLDAQLLAEPSTFFDTQTITSSNSSLVSATTSDGAGAPIGSTTVTVTQLAGAAQSAFTYTPPTTGSDTLSISDGVDPAQTLTVAANTSVNSLAEQINGSNTLNVWAAVSASGQLVLSSRNTGSQYTVSATDQTNPANLSTASTSAAIAAIYTINGQPATSHTDTVTGAIPGVTLTLQGVTGADAPVTITAQPPGPNTSSITSLLQSFVTDYNTAMSALQSAVNTQPASASSPGSYNPNSGSLFGDPELEDLISDLRDMMITPGSGLGAGLATMADLGVTTGASNGQPTQSSVDGELTLNTTTLANALASNPAGVQQVIQDWSTSFTSLIAGAAGPAGSIASRVSGNTTLASDLQNQYAALQANFTEQEQQMEEQWAQIESTMTELKSQSSYLTALSSSASSSPSSSRS